MNLRLSNWKEVKNFNKPTRIVNGIEIERISKELDKEEGTGPMNTHTQIMKRFKNYALKIN